MKARLCVLLVFLVCAVGTPRAHPVPFTYLDLHLNDSSIDGTLVAHIEDVAHDVNLVDAQQLLISTVLATRSPDIVGMLAARLRLEVDGQILAPEWSPLAEPVPDRQSVRLRFRVPRTSPVGRLTASMLLFPYDPMHRTFVNMYDGDTLTQTILDASRQQFEYFAGTRPGAVAAVRKFVREGVHHILIGPDHLLFLIALLLPGGTLRRLAVVVTGFTLAHSLTLSLAALNIVTPPPGLIEPAIALSIVCVGADNLLMLSASSPMRDLRAWMSFAFGFIHGFGFASVLREMDLPSRVLGWSLFSFNLGVELGQLAVVGPVALFIGVLQARRPAVSRRVAQAGSVIVAAAGVFWFAQRVF